MAGLLNYTMISPQNVEAVWPFLAPWIAQAIGDSDTWVDLEVIKSNCRGGNSRIITAKDEWGEIKFVLVTESWITDGRRVLVIRWLCGKDMHEWLEDIEILENFAANNGFQDIQIWGRPGWLKVCKPLGYRHEFTVIGKPLIRGLH